MNEHSLKLHFFMLERSQRKHNSLDCHKFFKYFPLIKKIMCSKIDKNQKKKLHIQSTQTLRMRVLVFFKHFYFFTECAPFFLKIGKDFNIV